MLVTGEIGCTVYGNSVVSLQLVYDFKTTIKCFKYLIFLKKSYEILLNGKLFIRLVSYVPSKGGHRNNWQTLKGSTF